MKPQSTQEQKKKKLRLRTAAEVKLGFIARGQF